MLRTTLAVTIAVIGATGVARATIEEWTSASTGFYIDDQAGTILITAAGTYKFQSYDGATPADIEWIRVQSGVTGTVRVSVYQDPNDGNGVGAANVKEIDLSNATTSYLDRLYISGNTATLGDVACDYMTDGDIDIGGDMGPFVGARTFSVNNATAAIFVHGTLGNYTTLDGGTLGDVTILGSSTSVQGNIKIRNTYSGTLLMDHRFDGDLTIGDPNDPNLASDLTGEVDITGAFLGAMLITGDVATGAQIKIRSTASQPGDALYGLIQVGGDLAAGGMSSSRRRHAYPLRAKACHPPRDRITSFAHAPQHRGPPTRREDAVRSTHTSEPRP